MAPAPTAPASATDKPVPATREKSKKKDGGTGGSSREKRDGGVKKKRTGEGEKSKGEEEAKTHRVGLRGSAKVVAEFVSLAGLSAIGVRLLTLGVGSLSIRSIRYCKLPVWGLRASEGSGA